MSLLSSMPTTAVARLGTMGVQMTTYFIAAVYTHFTETHRDVCPFYACTAMVTMLNLVILWIEETHKSRTDGIEKIQRAPAMAPAIEPAWRSKPSVSTESWCRRQVIRLWARDEPAGMGRRSG